VNNAVSNAVSNNDEPEIVGVIKVRACCLFTWHRRPDDTTRFVEVRPEHCRSCVEALLRLPGFQRESLATGAEAEGAPSLV
jgi:hypothetical protein